MFLWTAVNQTLVKSFWCATGTLLFLIYINDIHENLSPGTHIPLFADDSLLDRVIKNISVSLILQKDLDQLQKWEKANKIEFHPGKCQLIKITKNANI